KVGAWTLVAMLRLAAELRQARWRGSCLFVVDEPRLLGHEGRHLVDLFGTARDAGLGLVVADQGIAGLAAVHPDMPEAVLRASRSCASPSRSRARQWPPACARSRQEEVLLVPRMPTRTNPRGQSRSHQILSGRQWSPWSGRQTKPGVGPGGGASTSVVTREP